MVSPGTSARTGSVLNRRISVSWISASTGVSWVGSTLVVMGGALLLRSALGRGQFGRGFGRHGGGAGVLGREGEQRPGDQCDGGQQVGGLDRLGETLPRPRRAPSGA